MNEMVRLITVIPMNLAQQLTKTKRIQNYNAIGQINEKLIEGIKHELCERVGYENTPIACLSKVGHKESTIKNVGNKINMYLPIKAGDSVILELKMPEDSILSIEYKELLELSEQLDDAEDDEFEIGYILDELKDSLRVGVAEDFDTAISFISFVELEKCQFFATLNAAFKTNNFELAGVEKVELRQLSTFA